MARRLKIARKTAVAPAGAALLLGLALGLAVGARRGVPFVGNSRAWSIGVYAGPSPLEVVPAEGITNPVLTAADVTDADAVFVADPFLVRAGDDWCMFFEVLKKDTGKGAIGLATSSDGLCWTYQQIVLEEPFHLSYPCVFEYAGDWYMVPESHEAGEVRLYRASEFPTRWEYEATLLDEPYVDSTVFQHAGSWWMFTSLGAEMLKLYWAEEPAGPWTEHPQSPLILADPHITRAGGRVLAVEGKLYRLAQDTVPTYGNQVRAFEITELTRTTYAEREAPNNPVIGQTGSGWNGLGMHQLDALPRDDGGWIAAVDGYGDKLVYGWRY
ncbi:MAG: hypothetical protein JSV91_08610 [Phycisphaerales bacterium]|nr:MAG: hypothetical protein JSV91_08610 [Phycisphaerales bacterium]